MWGKAYNVHIHDLIVLQYKAVRICHGVSPRTNADKLCFNHNIVSLKRLYPVDTLRNNDVVITSKRRHFDVITSKWRRFDVITTLLLRHVFSGYSYNKDIFMYRFSKNMLPELFLKKFYNVASIHEHSTRSACLNHIYVKFKGATRGQKAFCYSGARIWNLILSHIETDCTIDTFKKVFAKLLLNSKEDLLSTWMWINMVIPRQQCPWFFPATCIKWQEGYFHCHCHCHCHYHYHYHYHYHGRR